MRTAIVCLAVAAVSTLQPGRAQAPSDADVLARIRAEGLERSHVLDVFSQLTAVIGPRLTNSPAHKRAIAYVQEVLRGQGLSQVRAEPFAFGRGWTLDKLSVEMVEPRYMPLIGYAKGWSPSTAGRLEAAPVWLPGLEPAAVAAKGTALRGAIVMTSPVQTYAIRADRPPASGDLKAPQPAPPRPPQLNAERLAALKAAGVGVLLEPNIGEHGTVFVTGRDMGPNGVPSVVLASEHYNLVASLLERGVPVTLAVEVRATFDESDANTANVVAEFPGVDPARQDQVVMVGAHLDSWHTGTGATDNADGVATAIEALRILKAVGVQPRRTIRVALWAGEEQGLLGSKAWVAQHLAGDANKAARDRMSVYFNLDNGYPPVTGFYMEGNEPGLKVMHRWLAPVQNLGATATTPGHIGATDHLSFLAVGVPGFQAVQDYVDYDVRTHHTNMDTAERIAPEALKQAAVVMATVLYQAAMSDQPFPRPPAR
ncbi:MAG: M20/M25/M40 family metallo-hydrolase [Vicinamibacterales bacterium]